MGEENGRSFRNMARKNYYSFFLNAKGLHIKEVMAILLISILAIRLLVCTTTLAIQMKVGGSLL